MSAIHKVNDKVYDMCFNNTLSELTKKHTLICKPEWVSDTKNMSQDQRIAAQGKDFMVIYSLVDITLILSPLIIISYFKILWILTIFYCMKPSKFKVNKCVLFSIMCTVCYIIPMITVLYYPFDLNKAQPIQTAFL